MATTQSAPALRYVDASFSYGGPPTLTGVTGEIQPGEALALIGPNGAGKTTLLRGILGTVSVSGTMEILGRTDGKVPKGSIGYVPQVAELDTTFPVTVRQVVMMGLYAELGWFRRPGAAHRERVDAALERVGMSDRANLRFGQLSGGQRQRVLLARSIVASPKMILLDEPFNGLDEPNREALLGIIHSVKREGVAVVVSTHDFKLAYECCEDVALLAGRQIAFGPISRVLTPANLEQAYGSRSTDQLVGSGLEEELHVG
ncbi:MULTISPECIES: metal ABC transporter ATP-binding protein [unclassified Corynebacterium]|uniref:metal ABC transporter ATP-binding protein n=1 Tax=unclassified Corynebacterium TaxID=2624378 RepID=UPI003523DEA8